MSALLDDGVSKHAQKRLGTWLCGRYRITRLIGVGGMAAVYAGVHRNGHVVAIKILYERLSADPEVERLFRREALLANKIQHPGVVAVTDDDVAEDGCIFLVMPLLEGETLRARAARMGGKLPVAEVARIAHALLETLQAAHAMKIVHRDIKPENVFVTLASEVRILDFGIARFFETNESLSATRSGRTMGTPAFMAPEQALGRLREIDGQSDLWSVGATMFTLFSGQFVHEGESGSELLVRAATRKPRPLAEVAPEVPGAFCGVVDRALAFEKGARWADAEAMGRALADACETALGTEISNLEPLSAPPLDTLANIHDAATEHSAPLELRTTAAVESLARPALDAPLARARAESMPRFKLVRSMGVALALVAAVAGFLRIRSATPPAPPKVSPLAEPTSMLACPIFEASGVPEPAGWLGAAAAATVCERARVILGGSAS
ncbi:MAG TPA: serine/threonine-protein kinase, partial [Polyangiaceae bacterium]|nr:serine/threonine-protein kinase [Polyangiaceae bacterium]